MAQGFEHPVLVPNTNTVAHSHLHSSSRESDACLWHLQKLGIHVVNSTGI